MQEQRIKAVCTGTVSTGSEEIKQHEIITIWGNRVRAGRVPMLATDVVWLVFGLGLLGVVHRQGEMMLEDAEECNNDGYHFGFCWGMLQSGLGDGQDAKFDSTEE